jgi:hypothetical protein
VPNGRGRRCHATRLLTVVACRWLPLAAVGCRSTGIHTVLLSLSARVAAWPWASSRRIQRIAGSPGSYTGSPGSCPHPPVSRARSAALLGGPPVAGPAAGRKARQSGPGGPALLGAAVQLCVGHQRVCSSLRYTVERCAAGRGPGGGTRRWTRRRASPPWSPPTSPPTSPRS